MAQERLKGLALLNIEAARLWTIGLGQFGLTYRQIFLNKTKEKANSLILGL